MLLIILNLIPQYFAFLLHISNADGSRALERCLRHRTVVTMIPKSNEIKSRKLLF